MFTHTYHPFRTSKYEKACNYVMQEYYNMHGTPYQRKHYAKKHLWEIYRRCPPDGRKYVLMYIKFVK